MIEIYAEMGRTGGDHRDMQSGGEIQPRYEWERVYEELQEQRRKSKTPQQADGASNLQRSKLRGL